VYYSTLGHVEQNWDDPRLRQMYVGAIKWAMGLVDADVTPRPVSGQSAIGQNYELKSRPHSEELGVQ
jgi:type 1 glutamine amidotransferase